jgi:hypothetical protein
MRLRIFWGIIMVTIMVMVMVIIIIIMAIIIINKRTITKIVEIYIL